MAFDASQMLGEILESRHDDAVNEAAEAAALALADLVRVVLRNRLDEPEYGVLAGVFGVGIAEPIAVCHPIDQSARLVAVTHDQFVSGRRVFALLGEHYQGLVLHDQEIKIKPQSAFVPRHGGCLSSPRRNCDPCNLAYGKSAGNLRSEVAADGAIAFDSRQAPCPRIDACFRLD
jgi:hypothetical protein